MVKKRKTTTQRVKLISFHVSWQLSNSKLSEAVLSILEENILLGLPLDHCCSLAGISKDTYSNWVDRGEKYQKAAIESIAEEKEMCYGEFLARMKKASAQWQKELILRSFQGEKFNAVWTRDLKLLERRDKDNWGQDNAVDRRIGSIVEDYRYL